MHELSRVSWVRVLGDAVRNYDGLDVIAEEEAVVASSLS
jgi:hypothetical protein